MFRLSHFQRLHLLCCESESPCLLQALKLPLRISASNPFCLSNPPLLEANFATQSPCHKFAVSEHLAAGLTVRMVDAAFLPTSFPLCSSNFCIHHPCPPSVVILKLASIRCSICVCTVPYHVLQQQHIIWPIQYFQYHINSIHRILYYLCHYVLWPWPTPPFEVCG